MWQNTRMKYKIVEDELEPGFINIIDMDTNDVFYSGEELYSFNQEDYMDQMKKLVELLDRAYDQGFEDIKEIYNLNDQKGN